MMTLLSTVSEQARRPNIREINMRVMERQPRLSAKDIVTDKDWRELVEPGIIEIDGAVIDQEYIFIRRDIQLLTQARGYADNTFFKGQTLKDIQQVYEDIFAYDHPPSIDYKLSLLASLRDVWDDSRLPITSHYIDEVVHESLEVLRRNKSDYPRLIQVASNFYRAFGDGIPASEVKQIFNELREDIPEVLPFFSLDNKPRIASEAKIFKPDTFIQDSVIEEALDQLNHHRLAKNGGKFITVAAQLAILLADEIRFNHDTDGRHLGGMTLIFSANPEVSLMKVGQPTLPIRKDI